MRNSVKSRGDEKEQLQQERQQLLDILQEISATEQQLEREREIAQTCASLAEACPGVYGRVVDLCKPSQKRLHVAVNVALAKFLDAVIVESSEAARACVRYLKERMLPPMTFLPMADLRVSALDPRLQNLVQSQRGQCLMSHVLLDASNKMKTYSSWSICMWCVKGWPRFCGQDCVQDWIAYPLMSSTRKPSTLCWGMSLWSECLGNCLVFGKRSLYGEPSDWPTRLIPWLMDDVLHLRIPASWAWPARHTNSLRFWLKRFQRWISPIWWPLRWWPLWGRPLRRMATFRWEAREKKNQPGSKTKGIEVPHPGIPWPGELGSHSSRCNSIWRVRDGGAACLSREKCFHFFGA